MEITTPLKILLISADAALIEHLQKLSGSWAELTVRPTLETGLEQARTGEFHAILYEVTQAKAAELFQVTALATRVPRLPVIIIGPETDEPFFIETVFSGAQEYLGRDSLTAAQLRRAVHGSFSRHAVRRALIDEKNDYRGIFDHLVEGVFRTTAAGRYLLANVALARIYGYDSPADLMASIQDIGGRLYVEPGRREEFIRLMQESDTLSNFESKIYRKDGEVIWIAENCRAVRDAQGRLLHYEGTVEDVTERKRAEEQIRHATVELSRSREELRQKNAMMQENLQMAREIQLAMLPQQYPVFPPGVAPEQSAFRFIHRYEAAESVSGDFFSVNALSEHEAGVFICDVAGHGVRAALVTAMIRALVEELQMLAHDPGSFLRKLNYDLCRILNSTGSPMLTTAFYAVADCRHGRLRFANAGHPKPLLLRRTPERIEPLVNAGGRSQPALGLFGDLPYQTSEAVMAPGDVLMLFTDGLYEVQGRNEELYSQERLILDLRELQRRPPDTLFDEVLQSVRAFSLSGKFEDDVCLVGMNYLGLPPRQP